MFQLGDYVVHAIQFSRTFGRVVGRAPYGREYIVVWSGSVTRREYGNDLRPLSWCPVERREGLR